ncbi:non-ribosomal peptide synthase/polyketide synthase, partial [Nocardia jiangsuensis]
VTVTDFVPSMLTVFVAHATAEQVATLRAVFVIGEALPPETAAGLRAISSAGLHNLYGPTEAAVSVTYWEATTADTVTVPIGIPEWNVAVYVLDGRLRPAAIGAPGELYLGGRQLARGYRGRADLTSDRFVANPFAAPGERMYRTGDLVRWNSDGVLEYIGRTDFQVKFRGQRIELGEIETVLLANPAISQAAVLVLDTATGQQLVAYVVPAPGATIDPAVATRTAAERLPSYMVPAALVVLDAFPLNTSGKLDRKGLPEPVFTADAAGFRAPRTAAEEIVAGIFADVLSQERVGADDNFFELGGNSLVATQVVARIGAAFGIRLGVRALFETPTVAAIAARAEHTTPAEVARPALTARQHPELVPLSLAQQRMWFLNQFDPTVPTYNLPFVVRLRGHVDVPALRAALTDVVVRQESLRTVFPDADGGFQKVLPIDEVDLGITLQTIEAADLPGELRSFASRGFDVSEDLPIRMRVFHLAGSHNGTGDYAVAFVVHHIAADGFSFGPLARDVAAAYLARAAGQEPNWTPLPVQYRDYTLWQRELLGAESDPESMAAGQIAYWRTTLADLPDQLDLPFDRPRPQAQSFQGAQLGFDIDAELHAQLAALARAEGVTLFMVVHAALALLLSRLSGSSDIAVGTPIAGRGEEALDDLIGMFVNTLVLRTQVQQGQTFTEFLGAARELDLAAFAHADVPFERLVEVLNPARSQARHPLFQVMLSFQELANGTVELPGLSVSAEELEVAIAKFDLQWTLTEHRGAKGEAGGIAGVVNFATDLFDAATVASFAERFVRVLRAVVADPAVPVGAVDVLDAAERDDLIARTGAPAVPPRPLAELMAAAAAVDPAAPAVIFDGVPTSYGELDEQSNRLARSLIADGIGAEDLVAVAVPRSADSVFAAWAVAKTGAAFVPVDPNYPAERIAHMVTDSGSPIGLTVRSVRAGLPESVRWLVLEDLELAGIDGSVITDAERVRALRPEHPAYVIYTSGSTGVPKGVVVTHSGLANFAAEQAERYGLDSRSRALHFASPSFDASILELLLALARGGALVVVPPGVYGGEELSELIRDEAVTHAFITPAALATFDPSGLDTLAVLVAGGEACPPELVAKWAVPLPGGAARAFHNGYGPTETTIMTNISAPLRPGEPVTIGGPTRGMQSLILDSRLRPVPVGVAGELYLSGVQLARGYHARPGLTAERFVANPFAAGQRMYRTGDVVRWTRTGEVEYVGRSDFQVKVRGFRIELGEIDAALAAHESVDFAVTIGHRGTAGGTSLVSYVVAAQAHSIDVAELTEHVEARLPGYMVPSSIMVLDRIPLTPVGKLDRRALPAPVFEVKEFRAPSTPIEEIVAAVFAEVLDLARVGVDDDFFELGGNSLIATQVASRVGIALDTRVPVRTVFEAPTVAALAARVESQAGEGARKALVARERPEQVPLSLAQQRMWFLNRFDTASAVNNIPVAIRLSGELDIAALQVAVIDVIDRHESLRTVFPETVGGPVQVVLDAAQIVPDLTPYRVSEDTLLEHLIDLATMAFDVTSEVPLHARLFEISETEYVLCMVVHHISADGWSMAPLSRDVIVAYAARTTWEAPAWTELPVQYADYALWQREVLGSEDDPESLIAAQIDYWSRELADLPDELALPADRPRPAVAGYRGGTYSFVVSAATQHALVELGRKHNASPFMVVHSALAVLLARLSGTDDIAIGTPVAGRGEAALDDLVGMFVNTLVLRTRVAAGQTFAELLAQARETDLHAFAHADLPFERLVEILNPARSQARHPLFQVMLAFQNTKQARLELPGLSVTGIDYDANLAKFDLQLTMQEIRDGNGEAAGMSAEFSYAVDLFDEATVAAFAHRLDRVLAAVIADPDLPVGDISLLDERERELALRGWNDTSYPLDPAETLVSAFAAQERRTPGAVAIVDPATGTTLTYAEFGARVHRLARYLVAAGAGPERLIGLALRRSVDLVVAAYAVQEAGGGYVPLDLDQPAERIAHVLETARPAAVLTSGDTGFTADGIPVFVLDGLALDGYADTPLTDADRIAPLRPHNPAYVIFTSGSTGRPKGVALPHAAVVNQVRWITAEYGIGVDDVVLFKTPATFDVSVWELFGPLSVGGRMVVASPDGHRDPAYLAEVIAAERVTMTSFVPSMLSVFASTVEAAGISSGALDSLRVVLVAGEAFTADSVQAMRRVSSAELHNLYGPTEFAVHATHHAVPVEVAGAVPIGLPVWNAEAYVLDARMHPVAPGIAGELYLAGAQLARGYFGRADLTADRFVANPYGGRGARMYRTGDLVTRDGFGAIVYLGRTDFQVKLRGLRIELGEIETALTAHETVAQAVALVRSDDRLGDRLVAYVVPSSTPIDVAAVREHVAAQLPSYMVPAALVVLAELPLNANGKLDRRALPEPEFEVREFRAPATPVQELVADTFARVLGIEVDGDRPIGQDDDFFDLGGNSLIATQVVARLGAALNTRVPVRMVFEAPTVAALAARVEAGAGSGRGRELVAGARPATIPLSLAQQRMWFLNRFDSATAVNNIPMAVRLTGALDTDALRRAVADVIERHEVLRTVYPETADGHGVQVVLPASQVGIDLTPITVAEAELEERISELVLAGFDVTTAVPVRAALLRVAGSMDGSQPDTHVLVFVVHHISGDGWSVQPLAKDVMIAYAARSRGEAPGWAPLPVQYADYALWQRETLGSEDEPDSLIAQQVRYWSANLAGLPDQLDLPADRSRPAVASNRGGVHAFWLDADLVHGLNSMARAHGASLFMVVHAALAALLARLSNSDDVAIGTAVAGRGEAALDDAIGMFVNTLVLRSAVDPAEPFVELLTRTRETDLAAFGHADLPFERLVEILNPARSQARHPLFQVMLSFQNTGEATFTLPGLEVAGVPLDVVTAKFDLHLNLTSAGEHEGMAAEFAYATDLFDPATVNGFALRLVRLLTAAVAAPATPVGEIELLDAAERTRVLETWNATAHPVDSAATLVSLFEAQAARTPDAPALTFEGETLSYAEFADRVHRLARHLIDLGVGPDALVALGMRRSFELVIGMYAVSAAGGAYVPLDPDHPAERIAYVLETARPVAVLTTERDGFAAPGVRTVAIDGLDLAELSGAPIAAAERRAPLRPSNTAYVIFTSGSTGRPKGVAVTHGAIVNRLVWMQAEYGLDATDTVLQKTPATFDVSVWEFFWPLQLGARLVVARPDGHRDPGYLVRIITEERVTVAHFVPSMMSVFVAEERADECTSLRAVFASGEALPAATAQRLVELTGARLHNLYGPTEAAVDVTFHEVTEADAVTVPIGAPVFNTRVYVLDSRLRPVPAGVPGELYLAGAQLARGYVARPELTADRFVASPYGEPGARMYRTGDLVTWRANGELEYLGRTDFQVKLRGLRIELGEIESALTALPSIAQSVVLVRSDDRLGDQLVAYVIPAAGATVDIEAVRAELGGELPGYMVPNAFVLLDAFPLNPSGKLDRRALPAPVFEAKVFRAPSTPIEEIVANTFADVLGVGRVGVDDDFFELGGNSLLATQVTARIGAALDTQLAVRDLFEASTVAALATRVERAAGSGRARPVLVAGERPEQIPLSPAQARYWFLNQFDTTTSAVDNIPLAVRLSGALDVTALEQAIGDVFARHEVLRTTYPSAEEGPRQVILPAGRTAPTLAITDVTEADLVPAVIRFAMTTFDVTVEVPLAVALFRITEATETPEHVVAFVVHHVAADGASMGPLARDLMAAYIARVGGEAPSWTPLPVQYADYALWQREVLGAEDDPESLVARQVAYWKAALDGLPDQLELPADRPRPPAQSFHGKAIRFEISPDRHQALAELARANQSSLFMVVHAALAVLLARLSGTEDIAVGTPIAGRGERELDDLIGMFVNTLVFRTRVRPEVGFAGLLAEVRDRDLEAFANADVPFERLVEVLNPERSTARNPLFQIGLSFQNLAETTITLPGLTVSAVDFDSQLAKTDLHVTLYDRYAEDGTPAEIITEFGYATDLFDEATVQGFADRFLRVLDAVIADPAVAVGELELLAADESERILDTWNDTAHPVDTAATLVSLLNASVEAQRENTALISPDGELSYAGLGVRVNRLARYLIERGVGPEDRVALAIRRSADLVIAMYAVAVAGAAYVPVDPDQPAERVEYILGTAAPTCVLTTAGDAFATTAAEVVVLDELDLAGLDGAPVRPAERRAALTPANTAYVIFTSGSTGQPKGVAVPHGAIANQLQWKTAEYGLGADDAVLLKTAATFDLSVWEFWSAAAAGGTLVIATADGHRDPAYLRTLMAETGVTTLHVVPSMLDALLTEADGTLPGSLRRVLAIGEALPAATAQRFRRGNAAGLFNLYGPTEAAVSITAHEVTAGDVVSVPIGVPEWNSRVYVLDSRLRPVPVGVSGELYLAGAQLARGYFARPELTADRFVASPFEPGARMYRTGDLVAWNAGGELEYRGRTDFQVKIRGFRIELGEIEAALLRQPGIAAAAVLARTDPGLGDRLVAYVVPAAELDKRALAHALAGELPSYMVPSAFVELAALPLNANGKLDRNALPEPEFEKAVFRAPSTPAEKLVARVFADVLGAEQIGADDDFFALGGNSILSIQLVSRAKTLGAVFSVRDVFDQRSVAGLAAVAGAVTGRQRLAELSGGGIGEVALPPALVALDGSDAVALRLPTGTGEQELRAALAAVLDRHEALRLRRTDAVLELRERGAVAVADVLRNERVTALEPDSAVADAAPSDAAELDAALARALATEAAALDPGAGIVFRAVRFAVDGGADVLLLVAHRLAVDPASWRIITGDLGRALAQATAGEVVELPAAETSLRRWLHEVAQDRETVAVTTEVDAFGAADAPVQHVRAVLPAAESDAVLRVVPGLYHGVATDALLTALALATARWTGNAAATVRYVNDLRPVAAERGAELTRTVGDFTVTHPLRLDLGAAGVGEGEALKLVKEQVLAVPEHGYPALFAAGEPGGITFRFAGARVEGFDEYPLPAVAAAVAGVTSAVATAGVTSASTIEGEGTAAATAGIEVLAAVGAGGELVTDFSGSLPAERLAELAELWTAALAGLAEHAGSPDAGGFTPSDMPLVRVRQGDLEEWERGYPGLAEVWPLTPLQSGLLFHALMTTASTDIYVMQAMVDLLGTVDADRLHTAAQGILDRYPNLRAGFVTDSDGQAVQVVPERAEVPWREVDLTDRDDPAAALRELLAADQATRFDMAAPPLVRFTLYRTAAEQYHLSITTHHVLIDGWSMPLLMQDLLVLYAVHGNRSQLPAVTPYRDFLGWLGERDLNASLRTWAEALEGAAEPTELASAARGPERYETGKLITSIDPERARRLTKHCADLGVTVNTLVQAAWGILIGRLTGRTDVVFGATVSGRPAELPGVESMVGLFINTLPVRVRIDDHAPIADQLVRLQREQADLLDHHYVGLAEIQRSAGAGSLFDTLLVFESYPIDREAIAAASSIDGMSVNGVGVLSNTHYPMTLQVTAESTIEFAFEYLTSRFTADEVRTLAARLMRVLEGLLGDPDGLVGDIDILDAEERSRLLAESGVVAAAPEPVNRVGARTVSKVLGEVVEADPEAPALLAGEDELPYHVLDRRSSQLARVLIGRGIGPDDVVAVALPRSVDSIVAVWAVQKAGAAALLDAVTGARYGIGSGAGELEWIDPADAAVRSAIAEAPAHPVSYADRVRPLGEESPAFVLADGTVFSQVAALDLALRARDEHGVDYESTTYTTATGGLVAVVEFLAAATAGALSVLPTGAVGDDLADGEVSHWFVAAGDDTSAAGDEVTIVTVE